MTKITSTTIDPQGKRLFALLCEAAGVERVKVRGITCRCEFANPVMFQVDMLAEEHRIREALDGDGEPV